MGEEEDLLPVTLVTDNHKAVVLFHGNLPVPLAVECRTSCRYAESLGLECPQLERELKTHLCKLCPR